MVQNDKQNLEALFSTVKDYFAPKIIAEVNDVFVKIVKVKGSDIPWHIHLNEDELFHVLKGNLTISIRDGKDINLTEGEMFVVKKGTEHRIMCDKEYRIMLIENKSTEHTGSVKTGITKTIDEQFY